MSKIPILTYHGLLTKSETTNNNRYNISLGEFEKQIKCLHRLRYESLSLNELFNSGISQSRKQNKVVITFDDGHKSNFKYVLPILKEYEFRATFFLSTGLIGSDKDFMNWKQVQELKIAGNDIQSHGHSHRFLNQISEQEIIAELEKSRILINEFIGKWPSVLSCPGGRFDDLVIKLAERIGYERIFTSEPEYFNPDKDSGSFLIGRMTITNDINLAQFKKILNGNVIFLKQNQLKYFLKNGLKKIIGDEKYHNIYKIVSK